MDGDSNSNPHEPSHVSDLENIVSDDSRLMSDKDDGELDDQTHSDSNQPPAKITKTKEADDELDFEDDVEDGEAHSDDDEDDDASPKKAKAAAGDGKKEDDEEGEVNSEDDLEEGEVKEDDDEADANAPEAGTEQKNQKSICRFFGAGKCTWGDSCRFIHQISDQKGKVVVLEPVLMLWTCTGKNQQRNYAYGRHQGPMMRPPPGRGGPDYYPPPPPMASPLLPLPHPHPPPPLLQLPNSAESSWERGVRTAKKMVAEASKRKEQEVDFDDKRLNQGVEADMRDMPPYHARHHHHSRSPSPRRRSPSPYYRDYHHRDLPPPPPHHIRERMHRDSWDSEYARRHRLAFESAPWNDDVPQRSPPRYERDNRGSARGGAEQFRDPWRRSKSPTRRGERDAPHAKESDSGSDLSGSDSDSDTDSSGSFGGKRKKRVAPKKKPPPKVDRRPPPKDILPRGTQPDVSRLPRIPKINRSNQPSDSRHGSYGSSSRDDRGRNAPPPRKDGYDSWSDSNSNSDSLGSGSESNSGDETRRRRHYRNYNEKSQPPKTAEKRRLEEPPKEEHLTAGKKRRSTEGGRNAGSQSPLSALSSSPRQIASPTPVHASPPHKKEPPSFSMKFNKKVCDRTATFETRHLTRCFFRLTY